MSKNDACVHSFLYSSNSSAVDPLIVLERNNNTAWHFVEGTSLLIFFPAPFATNL